VLTSFQVPADLIMIQPLGAQQPRVETPFGVREPRNRPRRAADPDERSGAGPQPARGPRDLLIAPASQRRWKALPKAP
jgi:hypothetical protein